MLHGLFRLLLRFHLISETLEHTILTIPTILTNATRRSNPSKIDVKMVRMATIEDDLRAESCSPGNVLYTEGFVDVWHKLVGKEEEEELCIVLLRYIEKILARVNNHDDAKVRKWAPERNIQHCCSQCGLNHEARDFIRAILLRLIDQLEKNDVVLNYLKDNDLLTQKDFELVAGRKT